jgi:mannose-6-phosphate isomerase
VNADSIGKYPLLLRPDNFTPLSRTPWAGSLIPRRFKSEVCPESLGSKVGESWEFSCDPDFPSRLPDGTSLIDLIRAHPNEVLGKELASKSSNPTCELLIKLLNADEPLSLQIHPADDDPFLKPNECGKPESWLVLSAEPGAGLYLGFNRAMSRDELRSILLSGEKARDVLNFVPVKAGDYFEIEPGVPHAIGPGLCLLEPQRIVFGKSGKTFRFWDWGRKYNQHGQTDPKGEPRELHLDAALRLADPLSQVGEKFVQSLRRIPEISNVARGSKLVRFPPNPYYQMNILKIAQGDHVHLQIQDGYAVASVLGGALLIENQRRLLSVCTGHTMLMPAHCHTSKLSPAKSEAEIAIVVPTGVLIKVH